MGDETIEAAVRSVYPKITATKLGELLDALEPFMVKAVREVAVSGAIGAVDRAEAFGLEFGLDALGRATSVYFPDGGEVAEWA